jgi:hypothetical protein
LPYIFFFSITEMNASSTAINVLVITLDKFLLISLKIIHRHVSRCISQPSSEVALQARLPRNGCNWGVINTMQPATVGPLSLQTWVRVLDKGQRSCLLLF